ncbi:MAG: acyl-CoA dehydrogenase family protein [bacterium]|nr:acyl-CoA dehydrogenase family protein [bacterium]
MVQGISFAYAPLPPEVESLRSDVRRFLHEASKDGLLAPSAEGGAVRFNRDFSRRLAAKGWIGMTWPRIYGGHERSHLERFIVNEELLFAGAPLTAHFTADRQSGPMLLKYASEDIKRDILPRICAGECTFSIGMSEPGSGSDLFAASSKAVPDGNGWRLSGRKVWTSTAHLADYMIGIFRTAPATRENRRHGLSQFLVDLSAEGISVNPIRYPSGDHHFNEVVLDDAFVPGDHLLGERDMAWRQATSELAYERSGPERFLETIAVLVELVRILGETPDRYAAIGLGRLIAGLQTLRHMSVAVAGMLARGLEPATEASVVKDLGTAWEQALPAIARDLAEGVGEPEARLRFEHALARAILIAPKLTIQGGTTEILRGIIARGLGLR